MKRWVAFATLLLGVFLSLPAAAQLQYFGYVYNGESDAYLYETRGFTNFAHTDAATPQDPAFLAKINNINAKGLRVTIDLGKIFWCGTNYNSLCSDWQSRWNQWKSYNASILTPDKVLAIAVRDEALLYGVNLNDVQTAAAYIKSDPSLSWIKIFYFEAPCKVAADNCGPYGGNNGFNNTTTTLPSVDWIGLDAYAIHPASDAVFLTARAQMKAKFPGKKWVYVGDGWWLPGLHNTAFGTNDRSYMETIAQEWYDVVRADPDAVLFGFFLWPSNPASGEIGSRDLPCNVRKKHSAIGRAITGKSTLPIGRLEGISNGSGSAYGYACDADDAPCEGPQVDLYLDGTYLTTATYLNPNDYVTNSQCSGGVAYRFRQSLGIGTSGRSITAVARDQSSGSVPLPSNCPENPACVWFTTYNAAKGYMEAISPSGVAAGWVCDPDAPLYSSKVRLILDDGTTIGTYTTNLASEQAVADECGGGYLHRFSVQLPASAHGRMIRALALDTVYGETQIPWLCDPGGYECTWY